MTAVPTSATPPTPPTSPAPAVPAPVRVYRSAAADARGKIFIVAFALWILAHVGIVLANRYIDAELLRTGQQRPAPPDTLVWFSSLDLQIGAQLFQTLRGSFLASIAWQTGGYLLILAAMVVLVTQRLRIIALLFPPALFLLAALFQCIAYNVYHPYMGQGSPVLTLVLMLACHVATWLIAPRNSGWRELRVMGREFIRDTLRNPGAQVFGPIFSKEVRVIGRRRGTYWLRFLYPLGLLGLVTLIYISATSSIDQFSSGAERVQRLQEIAPTIALFISWAQYLMLLFLAAALTSSAICDERRTRTLASLMTTPMSASQIVMGKLSSRLVQLLIMGLISIPFLMAIRVFGGLEARLVVGLIAITISSTFLMAALGILASVWSRKPASAIALAIILFLLFTVTPIIIAILWTIRTRGGPPDEIFAFSSPMAMVAMTMAITGNAPPMMIDDAWIANSAVNTALGIMAVFVASISLRGVMLSEAALEAPKKKTRRSKRRAIAASTPPAADLSAENGNAPPTSPPLESPEATREVFVDRDTVVGDQPVLWRELRQPALGSRRVMIVAAAIISLLILWMYTEAPPGKREAHMITVVIGMLLLVIQAAVASTPSVTSERDGSTWLTLLATPLTGAQILFPKLIGSLKKLWFIAAIIFAELVVGFAAGGVHPVLFLHLFIIILGTGIFLGGTGMLFSIFFKRSNAAALFNILLGGALWIGVPLTGALMSEFFLPRATDTALLEDAIFVINPVTMAVTAALGATADRGYWEGELPSGNDLNLFEYTGLVTGVSLIGALIGLAAVAIAAKRFNQFSGRSS